MLQIVSPHFICLEYSHAMPYQKLLASGLLARRHLILAHYSLMKLKFGYQGSGAKS